MSDSPRRYPFPGRYEGGLIVDALIDAYSLNGAEEWMGDTDTDGFHAIYHDLAGYPRENYLADAAFADIVLFGADLRFLARQAAAILTTDAQGFVWVRYYENPLAAQAAWENLRADLVPDIDVEAVFRGYVDAALWSSYDTDPETGEMSETLDALYGPDDIASDSLERMRRDVEDFVEANVWDLRDVDPERTGHDFWLTRNRHGAGFWDRGLGAIGDRLTDAAHVYGESNLYIGDDGLIHVTP